MWELQFLKILQQMVSMINRNITLIRFAFWIWCEKFLECTKVILHLKESTNSEISLLGLISKPTWKGISSLSEECLVTLHPLFSLPQSLGQSLSSQFSNTYTACPRISRFLQTLRPLFVLAHSPSPHIKHPLPKWLPLLICIFISLDLKFSFT